MARSSIATVHARRVWDSRGRPTVEAEVRLSCGSRGRAIAPAGASVGTGEALDRRDGGERFGGLDVCDAIASVNGEIANALDGFDAFDQPLLDRTLVELDGTPNKTRLGGNAIIAVSLANAHAAAAASDQSLWAYLAEDRPVAMPMPEVQIFGGGAHAARRVDIQDFMILPARARSYGEALNICAEVYRHAGALMARRGLLAGVADEGGFWPAFDSNEAALDALCEAIAAAGFEPGCDVAISLDVAASQFGASGRYRLALDGRALDTAGLAEMLAGWCARYPIVSLEDPFAEDDREGFTALRRALAGKVQIIGDDLLVTDAMRVKRAAAEGLVSAVLVKPNQAGTLTETQEAFEAARAAGLATIVSARSGESEDVTIAHLAVGWAAGQIKVGSFSRSERMAKWNELLRIEDEARAAQIPAPFAGLDALVR
jgi:enolase